MTGAVSDGQSAEAPFLDADRLVIEGLMIGDFIRRMIDMLVRLYDLPDSAELYAKVAGQGITLRRARAFEKHTVAEFARTHFSAKWVSEVEVALSRQPVACFIATKDKAILGFAWIVAAAVHGG